MSFSRLQLAAALIEYDNDNPKSRHPPRKATDSVIFRNARRVAPPSHTRSHVDGLPGRNRQSSASGFDGLPHQPVSQSTPGFATGRPSADYEEELADGPMERRGRRPSTLSYSTTIKDDNDGLDRYGPIGEVDLASWGLPEQFIASSPVRATSITGAETRGALSPARKVAEASRSVTDRPRSMYASSLVDAESSANSHLVQSDEIRPLSPAVERAISDMPSYGGAGDSMRRPLMPSGRRGNGARTVSFGDYDAIVEASQRERWNGETVGEAMEELLADRELDDPAKIERPRSSSGIMNRGRPTSPFRDVTRDSTPSGREPNHRTSSRSSSIGTARRDDILRPSSTGSRVLPIHTPSTEQSETSTPNPFALPAPGGERLSRFDPKAAAEARPSRPNSRVSGYFSGAVPISSEEDERDGQQRPTNQLPDDRRFSTTQLLRPKTLIMPTPLQSLVDPSESAPPPHLARGFQIGAKPLPPGALTRSDSYVGSIPGSHLTTSQKIFSSSLAVDGERDAAFIGGAEHDGEIGVGAFGGVEDEDGKRYGEEEWRPTRTVEGISLMDRLEARKAELKNKQRQFTGDARPSMMSRATWYEGMDEGPRALSPTKTVAGELYTSNAPMSPTGAHAHRISVGAKPLLSFDSSEQLSAAGLTPDRIAQARARMSRGKSVFGVDQVWEREMAKMRAEEEAERAAAEALEQRKREKEERRKSKKSKKGKEKEVLLSPPQGEVTSPLEVQTSQQDTPEEEATARRPSMDHLRRVTGPSMDVEDWVASSDEEEEGTVGRRQARRRRSAHRRQPGASDSDSDVPLSHFAKRPPSMAQPLHAATVLEEASSSEDDEPLSRIAKTRPLVENDVQSQADERDQDEDDVPLAIRRMTMTSKTAAKLESTPNEEEEEDDIPLGLKHSTAQQQRQSMAMTQQFDMMQRQSMFGMGGLPGMPTMAPMMGMPGMQMPFPPPAMGMPYMGAPAFGASMASLPPMPMMPDPSIDRWRRQVEPKEGSVFSERTSASRISALRSSVEG